MPSISPEAIKRKREHDRAYRAANKARAHAYRVGDSPEAIAYRDREQRRNQKRHHSVWKLHPSRTALYFCDGESSGDDGVYDMWDGYNPDLGFTELDNPDGVNLVQVVDALHKDTRRQRKMNHKRLYPLYFSSGYDHDQQVRTIPGVSVEQKLAIAKQRSRCFGAVRDKGWRMEEILTPYDLAVYVGRKHMHAYKLWPRNPDGTYPTDGKGDLLTRWTQRWGDIFSLFNRSFLRAWEVFEQDLPVELRPDVELVKQGKPARGKWSELGWGRKEIRAYNHAELRIGHWLATEVIKLAMNLELTPRNIYSPADFSRALITKYGVGQHIKPDNYDTVEFREGACYQAISASYFGGRIELDKLQTLLECWEYDLNSAYPSAFRRLPCLAHGSWRRLTPQEIDQANKLRLNEWAIYRIQWKMHEQAYWGPFPVRRPNGSIFYPLAGQGWYCTPEVRAFFDTATKDDRAHITSGWIWVASCTEHRPFQAMIDETYAERARLSHERQAAEYLLKLSLNSLYGTLAQNAGGYRRHDVNGRTTEYHTPRFHNLYGAAYITSYCRAAVYRHAMQAPSQVVAFMTDCVIAKTPLQGNYPTDKPLGQFSEKHVTCTSIFMQPGVVARENGKHKTRGFPVPANFYEMVRSAVENEEVKIEIPIKIYQDMRRSVERMRTKAAKGEPGTTLRFTKDAGKFLDDTRDLIIGPLSRLSKRDWEGNPYKGGGVSKPYRAIFDIDAPDLSALDEEIRE